MVGGWKLRYISYFMETTHEAMYSVKWSLVHWNIMYITTSSVLIIMFFDEAFKHGDGAKFWGYVGKNAQPLCV
jgi:hypothetical protein